MTINTFLSLIIKTEYCWIWSGGKTTKGYGSVVINKKNLRAHRLSYEFHIGPIPKGKHVCHKCDNPSCVNPDHLFLATNLENHQDSARKKRRVVQVGERNHNAKLKDSDLNDIIEMRNKCVSLRVIGDKYGVTPQAIWRAIKRFKIGERNLKDLVDYD